VGKKYNKPPTFFYTRVIFSLAKFVPTKSEPAKKNNKKQKQKQKN
jgi:hypothetical protein